MESKRMYAVFYAVSGEKIPRYDSIWEERDDAESYAQLNNKKGSTVLHHFVATVLIPVEATVETI